MLSFMSRLAKWWLVFWSVFYGVGAPLLQGLYIRKNGFINQSTFADLVLGLTMLISLVFIGRPIGRLLDAIVWGGFLAVFSSALTYFFFFLKADTPVEALYATGLGIFVALTCVAVHLASNGVFEPLGGGRA